MDTRPEPVLPSQVEARDGDFWLGLPQSRCQGGATDRAARGDPKLSPSHGAAAVPYLGWSVGVALEWEKGAASAHARSSNLPSARLPFARSSCQVSRHTSAISPHPPPLDLSRPARSRLNRKPHSEFAVAPRCLSSWKDAKVGSAPVASRRAGAHRTCMAISCDHGRHGWLSLHRHHVRQVRLIFTGVRGHRPTGRRASRDWTELLAVRHLADTHRCSSVLPNPYRSA